MAPTVTVGSYLLHEGRRAPQRIARDPRGGFLDRLVAPHRFPWKRPALLRLPAFYFLKENREAAIVRREQHYIDSRRCAPRRSSSRGNRRASGHRRRISHQMRLMSTPVDRRALLVTASIVSLRDYMIWMRFRQTEREAVTCAIATPHRQVSSPRRAVRAEESRSEAYPLWARCRATRVPQHAATPGSRPMR